MLRKLVSFFIGTLLLARGGEETAKVVSDLESAYSQLNGFTATYTAQAPGKSLEVTMGLDELSQLCYLHAVASKGGHSLDIKQWTTEEDEFVIETNGAERRLITGIQTELKSLNELLAALNSGTNTPKAVARHQGTPCMLLSQDGINPSVLLIELDQPFWLEALRGATIKENGEASVTFQTTSCGLLEISRENGLLVSQTMLRSDGETVTMKLSKAELNPGAGRVREITKGWSRENARVVARGTMLGPIRMEAFQLLINAVEEGRADLEVMSKKLVEQRPQLRRFAEGFATEIGGSLAADETWQQVLDDMRTSFLDKFRKDHPQESDERAGKFVDGFLGDASNRQELRDHIAASFANRLDLRQLLMFELGGKNRDVELLVSKDENGKRAKELIEVALFRAYAEAVLERKMGKRWGEREGLE